jgi:hypothetical protein
MPNTVAAASTNGVCPAPLAPAPTCPDCGGPMWDNRADKRNPRAPDFKCKNRVCDGAVWPPRNGHAPSTEPHRTIEVASDRLAASSSPPGQPHCGALSDGDASADDPTVTLYRASAAYVATTVCPVVTAAGVPLTGEAVAAMIATLFIARHSDRARAHAART